MSDNIELMRRFRPREHEVNGTGRGGHAQFNVRVVAATQEGPHRVAVRWYLAKAAVCRFQELRGLMRRGFDRQDELKCCARPGIGSRPQPTAVSLDNRAADRQPHSGALRFGRDECTEDLIDLF